MFGDWLAGNASTNGRTLGIESQESGKYCCIDEKGKQLGDPAGPRTRVQAEWRGHDRLILSDGLTRPGSYLAGAQPCLAGLDVEQVKIKTITTAAVTGLRQGNVQGLDWRYVDLDRRHAWIPGSKHKNGKAHSVPLNELALPVLRKQIGEHPTRVFTCKGEPISQANTKARTSALERAGIEDFKWHDLGHTFATWHRQGGTPTYELQRLGGWRTGAMVERYAHVAPEALQGAATRLDQFSGYEVATTQRPTA